MFDIRNRCPTIRRLKACVDLTKLGTQGGTCKGDKATVAALQVQYSCHAANIWADLPSAYAPLAEPFSSHCESSRVAFILGDEEDC